MSSIKNQFLLLWVLTFTQVAFASEINLPKLPIIQHNACPGEEQKLCGYPIDKTWRSNQVLKLYNKSQDQTVAATLPVNSSFEIQGMDLHTVAVASYKVQNASLCVDAEAYNPTSLKPGDVIHQISYFGEGHYMALYGQQFLQCDFLDQPWEKIQGELETESWYKIIYKNQTYWWKSPKECASAYDKPATCPIFKP